jgi:hypothetical protein
MLKTFHKKFNSMTPVMSMVMNSNVALKNKTDKRVKRT